VWKSTVRTHHPRRGVPSRASPVDDACPGSQRPWGSTRRRRCRRGIRHWVWKIPTSIIHMSVVKLPQIITTMSVDEWEVTFCDHYNKVPGVNAVFDIAKHVLLASFGPRGRG
jgi:hypothetical protein